ncbi:hypothetical protein SUGI_0902310 [Cryptomeria japonica]|nr:hypothetical protein SUGI_0902310 [Cryptomeria japonica]
MSLTTLPPENIKMNFWPTKPSNFRETMDHYALEIQKFQNIICKNGEWIPVQPIPGVLVINIGDMLRVTSNGIYKSIEHREVTDMYKD